MASNPKWSLTGTTSGVLYASRRDFDLHPEQCAELWGNLTPFHTWVTKLNSEEVNDTDF